MVGDVGRQILSGFWFAQFILPSSLSRSELSKVCISSTLRAKAVAKCIPSKGFLHSGCRRISFLAAAPIRSSTTTGFIHFCLSNCSIFLSPSLESGLAGESHFTLNTSAKVKNDLISTSHVEKQNHTLRMHCRRLTRLTNAFSKKLENFKAAVALHYAYYNFVKSNIAIRCTPAMAAGVANTFWTVRDLAEMIEG